MTADVPDPHDVLGVARGASAAAVHAAYRRLARRYHPDAPGGGDPARMQAVNAAYAALRNGSPTSAPVPPARAAAAAGAGAGAGAHPPTQSENRPGKRPETPIAWEDARALALPSRRVVVMTLVVLAVLVAGLAVLAATGDEVIEPRVATVTATGMRFVPSRLRLRADAPVELRLVNRDPGQRHNVVVERAGTPVARGAPTTGPTQVAYDFGPLPSATYTFRCEIVPAMTGTLTVA